MDIVDVHALNTLTAASSKAELSAARLRCIVMDSFIKNEDAHSMNNS